MPMNGFARSRSNPMHEMLVNVPTVPQNPPREAKLEAIL